MPGVRELLRGLWSESLGRSLTHPGPPGTATRPGLAERLSRAAPARPRLPGPLLPSALSTPTLRRPAPGPRPPPARHLIPPPRPEITPAISDVGLRRCRGSTAPPPWPLASQELQPAAALPHLGAGAEALLAVFGAHLGGARDLGWGLRLGWSCRVCCEPSAYPFCGCLWAVRGRLGKVFDVVSSSRTSDPRGFGHAVLEEGVTLTPDREPDSLEWESRLWRPHFSYPRSGCFLLWTWDRRPATACLEH